MKPAESPVKPVLPWPGSKRRLLKHLLPLIPESARCYCEVFGGSAALLLAKPRHPVEVVNDMNRDLVALMRNAHCHLPALLEEMHWFIASRADLHDFRAQPGLTEIQRAARFLLRHKISFGGGGTSFGVSKTCSKGFDRDTVGSDLEALRKRLNRVVVEELPYDRCLQNYDSPDTVLFLDPPYVDAPTGAYDGWTQSEMVQFRSRVDRLQGRWIVTINDSPANRDLFGDCKIRPVRTVNRKLNQAKARGATFGELIITRD